MDRKLLDDRSFEEDARSIRPRRYSSWSNVSNCILVLALVFITRETWLPSLIPDTHRAEPSISAPFSWQNTKPSEKFAFTPCYNDFQCARLEVQMDRNNDDDNDKVILAVIKLPAKVPVTDPRYGGAVFFNPGGPGGSGVNTIKSKGKALQTVIDSGKSHNVSNINDGTKFFDAISWDPRGIGDTTPGLRCFPDDFSRDIWDSQKEAIGLLGALPSDAAFDQLWARENALGQQCAQQGYRSKIAKHMNTVTVIGDMVDMLERYGEWRENEAKSLLKNQVFEPKERITILEQTRWNRGEEKLQYWGFSYGMPNHQDVIRSINLPLGTVIGATFAALHPNRVHRIIIDGVVDCKDFYSKPADDIEDIDTIMDKFAEYCYAAGPENCSFHTGNSPADILTSLEEITSNLRETPLVAKTTNLQSPEIVTYGDFMRFIFRPFYGPYKDFPRMADVFSNLRAGNGSMLADIKRRNSTTTCPNAECRREGPFGPDCLVPEKSEAYPGIECTDREDSQSITREESNALEDLFFKSSKWGGNYWATSVVPVCPNWKIRPAIEYHGPVEGNTSFPILFVSTTYDPVCPLRGARTMATRFPGSILLEQASEGHCSISSPSLCTAHYISSYFQTGNLPDPGTVCLPDVRPFGLPADFGSTINEAGRSSLDEPGTVRILKRGDEVGTWSVEEKERLKEAGEKLTELEIGREVRGV